MGISGMDDPQMRKVQGFKGLVHRFGRFRGFAEFAFNSIAAAVKNEEEMNLSTTMGGPEKCLGGVIIRRICSMAKPSHDAPTRALGHLSREIAEAVKTLPK
jgi:hypothetical protein